MLKLNEQDNKILLDLDALPYDYWDFSDSSTDDLIHSMHNYPAVMIYPISRSILDIVSKYKKIECLMDPFCGSGTVVVEGQIKNIPLVIGNDLNPLARLITNAKTKRFTSKDFEDLTSFIIRLDEAFSPYAELIVSFDKIIKEKYDISDKNGWALNAEEITNDFLKENSMTLTIDNKFKNLGFWFSPSTLIPLQLIKNEINLCSNDNLTDFLNCSFSETVRFVSNTRNSEFKLYRIKKEKVQNVYFDVLKEFKRVISKNESKMNEYVSNVSSNSQVSVYAENCQSLESVKDESVDIVITSPPYGDSHTTVAYGQFSKLSSQWLGQINNENIDSLLLGGKKNKVDLLSSLESPTLELLYRQISQIDEPRAKEVLSFYFDLDKSIKAIAKKTKIDGYQFWVVGNRTVKKVPVQTDVILAELAKKYNLEVLKKYYRRISNKVMPSVNCPTNIAGDTVTTMVSEIILFFKKVE